jgi:hypothetical protein
VIGGRAVTEYLGIPGAGEERKLDQNCCLAADMGRDFPVQRIKRLLNRG